MQAGIGDERPGRNRSLYWARSALSACWYVAQLKAARIAINGLSEQGFENYYPQMQVTRARQGRVFDASEPVFPNYLFLRSEPDPHRWRAINNTRGVVRLLGNCAPCAIPDREIDRKSVV